MPTNRTLSLRPVLYPRSQRRTPGILGECHCASIWPASASASPAPPRMYRSIRWPVAQSSSQATLRNPRLNQGPAARGPSARVPRRRRVLTHPTRRSGPRPPSGQRRQVVECGLGIDGRQRCRVVRDPAGDRSRRRLGCIGIYWLEHRPRSSRGRPRRRFLLGARPFHAVGSSVYGHPAGTSVTTPEFWVECRSRTVRGASRPSDLRTKHCLVSVTDQRHRRDRVRG